MSIDSGNPERVAIWRGRGARQLKVGSDLEGLDGDFGVRSDVFADAVERGWSALSVDGSDLEAGSDFDGLGSMMQLKGGSTLEGLGSDFGVQ